MIENIAPVIRKANSSDASLLAALGAETFRETFASTNTAEDMTAYLSASFGRVQIETELAEPTTTFLIVEVSGEAIGYAMLREDPAPQPAVGSRPVEIVRFYILKKWHGRGIADTLMRACFAESLGQGYHTIWLGVWEHNARARAFYRKWKFEEFGEHIFQLGGDAQNDFLMRRPLSDEL